MVLARPFSAANATRAATAAAAAAAVAGSGGPEDVDVAMVRLEVGGLTLLGTNVKPQAGLPLQSLAQLSLLRAREPAEGLARPGRVCLVFSVGDATWGVTGLTLLGAHRTGDAFPKHWPVSADPAARAAGIPQAAPSRFNAGRLPPCGGLTDRACARQLEPLRGMIVPAASRRGDRVERTPRPAGVPGTDFGAVLLRWGLGVDARRGTARSIGVSVEVHRCGSSAAMLRELLNVSPRLLPLHLSLGVALRLAPIASAPLCCRARLMRPALSLCREARGPGEADGPFLVAAAEFPTGVAAGPHFAFAATWVDRRFCWLLVLAGVAYLTCGHFTMSNSACSLVRSSAWIRACTCLALSSVSISPPEGTPRIEFSSDWSLWMTASCRITTSANRSSRPGSSSSLSVGAKVDNDSLDPQ